MSSSDRDRSHPLSFSEFAERFLKLDALVEGGNTGEDSFEDDGKRRALAREITRRMTRSGGKRAKARVAYAEPLSVIAQSNMRTLPATGVDLSDSGMRIIAGVCYEELETLWMMAEDFEAEGMIVWMRDISQPNEPRWEYGIRFRSFKPKNPGFLLATKG